MTNFNQANEDMLLRGIFERERLIASIATHAAMDILDRSSHSPYFMVHFERQVGQLSAEIALELTGIKPFVAEEKDKVVMKDVNVGDHL